MQQSWKINIKDFGKIQQAEIEIAPFMVFLGENNSGKSYFMSLLWGILALGRALFPKNPPKSESYLQCEDFIARILVNDKYILESYDIFIDFFNSILKEKRSYLLKHVFSIDSLNIKELYISDYKRKENLTIEFTSSENTNQKFSSGKNYVRFPVDKSSVTNNIKYKMIQYICWKLLMADLTAPFFPLYDNKRISGEPLFLPASRTGFMLTYKALSSEAMNVWGYDSDINSKFTLPIIKFLQSLIQQKQTKKSKYKDILEFLEEDLLDGKIQTETKIINDYKYYPKNLKRDLPLYITSSLVVELSPLFIFLNSNLKFKSIFIEEIESHLHPKMQKLITQIIIRLINRNLPVFITTHSDIVFQHINNMIKLFNAKNQKELLKRLNFKQEDMLNPAYIKVYEFVIENNKTIVKPLKLTKQGFEVPTFNNALIELANETMTLSEDVDD
jgi:hypothetical protein